MIITHPYRPLTARRKANLIFMDYTITDAQNDESAGEKSKAPA
jgi:hypothetical protein